MHERLFVDGAPKEELLQPGGAPLLDAGGDGLADLVAGEEALADEEVLEGDDDIPYHCNAKARRDRSMARRRSVSVVALAARCWRSPPRAVAAHG